MIKVAVRRYYLSTEVSREVPNKKEVVKVKTADEKKEVLQKHVMTMTLQDAYKNFTSQNPDIKLASQCSKNSNQKLLGIYQKQIAGLAFAKYAVT
jgi:hypothetical protein